MSGVFFFQYSIVYHDISVFDFYLHYLSELTLYSNGVLYRTDHTPGVHGSELMVRWQPYTLVRTNMTKRYMTRYNVHMNTNDNLAHYICGLVDGEGYFGILAPVRGMQYTIQFIIKLRGDDAGILYDIHAFLGVGDIKHAKDGAVSLRVLRAADQLELIKFFDKYPLRAKKKRDYTIWREAVIEKNKPVQERDLEYMKYLCNECHKIKG